MHSASVLPRCRKMKTRRTRRRKAKKKFDSGKLLSGLLFLLLMTRDDDDRPSSSTLLSGMAREGDEEVNSDKVGGEGGRVAVITMLHQNF